jgi:mycothiol synthase
VFRVRPPTLADASAVLSLLVARDVADLGAPDITLQDLQDQWRGSEIDLRSDARVIEAGGEIIGYAMVHRRGAMAVVSPDHEGRGIGTRLRTWVELRDRQLDRDAHRQWVPAAAATARHLLTAAGYRRVRSYWRMVCRLDASVDPGPLPDGIQVRPVDLDADGRSLYELDAESFSATADYVPESFQAFSQEHLHAHDAAPELSRVACHRQTPVGFALARRWAGERVGFVDLLAVAPDHQRRGIGTALLRHAFSAFAADGLREAQLGVASDNPTAQRLYERAGMTTRFRVDIYERRIG